ncbi:MAG: nuclear transport factor 2 family protein [Bacteroidales bacterium]|nr:nuclear transport factor 2 family protein [Bacteroidales bacterium]
MKKPNTIEFQEWLEKYFSAWENQTAMKLHELFAEDAVYNETPFSMPLNGLQQIIKYWTEGAQDSQRDIRTNFRIVCVQDNKGYAKWQAQFIRTSDNNFVELDGMLEVVFNDNFKAAGFNEWWHRRESAG